MLYTLTYTSKLTITTQIYDKRDFSIVNFPFICSTIPATHAYGVCIAQLMQYPRACGFYRDFLDRGVLLTRKLLNHGLIFAKLKSLLRVNYGHHLFWSTDTDYLCHKWPRYVPKVGSTSRSFPHSWLIIEFVTVVTWRLSHLEQELNVPPFFTCISGVRVVEVVN